MTHSSGSRLMHEFLEDSAYVYENRDCTRTYVQGIVLPCLSRAAQCGPNRPVQGQGALNRASSPAEWRDRT